jgi:hypothetical protein
LPPIVRLDHHGTTWKIASKLTACQRHWEQFQSRFPVPGTYVGTGEKDLPCDGNNSAGEVAGEIGRVNARRLE